jgi:hypothetical protein
MGLKKYLLLITFTIFFKISFCQNYGIIAGDTSNLFCKIYNPPLIAFDPSFDVDQDGITDFDFNVYEDGSIKVYGPKSLNGLPDYGKEICIIGTNAYGGLADTLDYLAKIDKSLNWDSQQYQSEYLLINDTYNHFRGGYWESKIKYLGFRIIYPVDTVYGWFHLGIDTLGSQTFKIFDWAVQKHKNSISESSIKAGDTTNMSYKLFEPPVISGSYEIDYNNDGQNDFTISSFENSIESSIFISQYYSDFYSDAYCSFLSSEYGDLIDTLDFDQKISSEANWKLIPTGSTIFIYKDKSSNSWIGNWDETTHFIGLRLRNENGVKYGWIKMSIDTSNFVNFKIYAYAFQKEFQNLPDQIFQLTDNPKINIYPNPANKVLYIEKGNNLNYEVKIFSLNGEIKRIIKFQSNKLNIDISDFTKGMYLIRVSNQDFEEVKKIIIE